MEFFISVPLGLFIGFMIAKGKVEQRMMFVLQKSGWFNETQLGQFQAYYKNYNKIQKEVSKELRDNAMRLERDFRLRSDKSNKL